MKKLTKLQQESLMFHLGLYRIEGKPNWKEYVNKVFGIPIKAIEEKEAELISHSKYAHASNSPFGHWAINRQMRNWVRKNTRTKKHCYILAPVYSEEDRAKFADLSKELEMVDGYGSEYSKYGRTDPVFWLKRAGLPESMIHELDTIQVEYDDSCGLGGGHHTPCGYSAKADEIAGLFRSLAKRHKFVPVA